MLTPILLKKFAKKTGVTEDAVRKRLSRGVWQYGNQCIKDPEGQIHVIWEKYLAWLEPSGLLLKAPPLTKESEKVGKKQIPKCRAKSKVNPYKV